jgi:hypothetical protein
LICELVQLFYPHYVAERSVTIDLVARLPEIKPFWVVAGLHGAFAARPAHLSAAANGFSIDHGDVGAFTKGILNWWKSHASEVGAWSETAHIAFTMAPNSAGAERVFRCSGSCSEATKTLPFPTTFSGQ